MEVELDEQSNILNPRTPICGSMAADDVRMETSPDRFKIYAIDGQGAGEMVRWTDTRLKKDHHDLTQRTLTKCRIGSTGFSRFDAEAFLKARRRFLGDRVKGR